MSKIDHVLIDMDGVLCNFIGAAFVAHGGVYDELTYPRGEWSIAKVLGITDAEFWKKIDLLGEDFWASLDPYPWMSDLIQSVHDVVGDEWSIATSPSRAHFSASGKVRWLQSQFGSHFRRYMLGEQKFRLAKPGVVLIDDSSTNCAKFAATGGEAIEFPQPWNVGYVAKNRILHVKNSLCDIQETT